MPPKFIVGGLGGVGTPSLNPSVPCMNKYPKEINNAAKRANITFIFTDFILFFIINITI
jgi:hypothetical protein